MEEWLEAKLIGLDGKPVKVSDFQGWKVLYFFPRAMTSGCTMEAEDFSRLHEDFLALGVTIIGVSTDNVERLKKFKEKVDIPFVIDPAITSGCRQFDLHDHKKVARHLKGAVENVRQLRSGTADENPFAL